MSIQAIQSFSPLRCVSPYSGTTTSTPSWRVADIETALRVLQEGLERPRVIITWLEANTASLIGPFAAAALTKLLEDNNQKVNEFLKEVLAWRITQDLGVDQNVDAALHAWRTNLKALESGRGAHGAELRAWSSPADFGVKVSGGEAGAAPAAKSPRRGARDKE